MEIIRGYNKNDFREYNFYWVADVQFLSIGKIIRPVCNDVDIKWVFVCFN